MIEMLCYGTLIRAVYCAMKSALDDDQRREVDRLLHEIADSVNCTEIEAKMLRLFTVEWGADVPDELCERPPLRLIAGGAA
jgi:hypothetical protein